MPQNPFDRFTKESKKALQVAEEEAKKAKLHYIGTEHLLLGILSVPNSLGCSILLGIGISYENVKIVLDAAGQKGDTALANSQISTYLAKVIEDSMRVAMRFKHNFVGTEHLLHALIMNKKCAAAVVLNNMQVNIEDLKDQIEKVLGQMSAIDNRPIPPSQQGLPKGLEELLSGLTGVLVGAMNQEPEKNKLSGANKKPGQTPGQAGQKKDDSATPALDYFGQDLIVEARNGKLDPVIGRAKELERVIHILNRKTKNNPVLIGEPGVGKTAIVEGLAQAIINQDVPHSLLKKRVVVLDLGEMIAGTKFRGEFEERLKDVISEAVAEENEIILFIDELHTLVGAGASEGSLDAANILKPALSRGKIQVIGATTLDEYRKYIEKDKALERRFQPVTVDEPSETDALAILRGLRGVFEDFHKLHISDEALESSVALSKRYITDRYLPDKAIDLIDEACAGKGENGGIDKEKVRDLHKEIQKIEAMKTEAVSRQEYKKAVSLKAKQEKIQEEISSMMTAPEGNKRDIFIGKEDIAKVIASMTGIPVNNIIRGEFSKLKELEVQLEAKIIGQNEAIQEVSKAILRSKVGLSQINRPLASFIFMGPSGVGKTELVKQLAKFVYEDKDALIKIDMSEFMEKHNVSRLVGATAGYVGYEEGGQLTESVRRKPYAVVLFDEIEKAHKDVGNVLLQVMEDGYLTDAKGKKVDFRNTIIVMTSNIGAEILSKEAHKIGFSHTGKELAEAEEDFSEKAGMVKEELKRNFSPEFLNRVDKVIVFKPLAKKEIRKILELQLEELKGRMKDKKLTLAINAGVMDALTDKSYDPEFGARKVRQIIREDVEDLMVDALVAGRIHEGDTVTITKKKGKEGAFEIGKSPETKKMLKVDK